MLIAIDFDGTIVEHTYPEIGQPLPGAIETIKKLQSAGHHLILNTCREDTPKRQYLTEAVNFLRSYGVEFRSVNENTLEDDFRADWPKRRKVHARWFIDDRNFGGFPGWDIIAKYFNV